MEQILLDLFGHSVFILAIVIGGYHLLKHFFIERIQKWDASATKIDTHEATCTRRYESIAGKLETICESQERIETTTTDHGQKIDKLSTTVAVMVGRQEERDRQGAHP